MKSSINVMKYEASCLALTFIGPQISELINDNEINCNEVFALIPLPDDFLVVFPTKQFSQISNSILVSEPNKPFLANLFVFSYPICPNQA